MKKEFKAPIVESKELFTQNIMAEIAIFNLSAGQEARKGIEFDDSSVVDGYKKWEGLK